MYGAIVTILFVLAALYLAYRRLPLLIYTLTFTGLLLVYAWLAGPPGFTPNAWQWCLWGLLALLWLRSANCYSLRRITEARLASSL